MLKNRTNENILIREGGGVIVPLESFNSYGDVINSREGLQILT